MSKFELSVHSFTPPTLPEQPTDVSPDEFRSPLGTTIARATSPLCFTVSLPSARKTNPLFPAGHLQLVYHWEDTGDVFVPRVLTSKDLDDVSTEAEPNLYSVQIPPSEIARAKVNHGTTSTADVQVHAWKREKLLGKWHLGQIEGLGFVGLKSGPEAVALQKIWGDKRAAWQAAHGR